MSFLIKVENTSIRARKSRSKFCSCTFCISTALSEKSLNQIARNYFGKKCFTKKKIEIAPHKFSRFKEAHPTLDSKQDLSVRA